MIFRVDGLLVFAAEPVEKLRISFLLSVLKMQAHRVAYSAANNHGDKVHGIVF